MNELSYEELLKIHAATLVRHGGLSGVKDEGLLLSALAQPSMGFGDQDTYPTIQEKTAALGFSLVKNHGFNDGNKRVAFLAMGVFLYKNGYLLDVPEPEATRFMLALAASEVGREELIAWIESGIIPLQAEVPERVAPGEIERLADEERLSFAERTPISPEALQIEAERSSEWKMKMFGQVLKDEIAKCASEREEHRQGVSSAPKRVLTQSQFFPWMGSRLKSRHVVVENQERIVTFLSSEAFSQTVVGVNLDYLIGLARELGGIYRYAIVWSQQFRQVAMPPEYADLLHAIATFSDRFVEQFEHLPQLILDGIQKGDEHEGEEPYVVKITLDFAPQESDRMENEIKALGQK
ncbi:type II toxin-antitoxin system death-on-curing family toxin, partial [bacterium]